MLKHLTAFIPGGTKVGVVGRTGSGKSTLLLAIFRILEPDEVSVVVVVLVVAAADGIHFAHFMDGHTHLLPQRFLCLSVSVCM